MIFWDYIVILNFLVASMGLTANLAFFRLVVFCRAYDVYCRISAFIISSGMTLMILSNICSIIMCLSYDSYFDSGPCGQTESHILMVYLHAYGEFSIADGIFILIFERYASVFLPSFRTSDIYKLCFLAGMSIHIMGLGTYLYLMVTVRSSFAILLGVSFISSLFLISLVLAIYLICASKNKYYETLGLISLTQRYMLAESYELCKSVLPATFVTLTINIGICFSAWLLLLGYILQDYFYEFFAIMNMIMNVDATLFPLLFLYESKKIRKKICKIAPFHLKLPQGIRQLNGHRISVSQSQNEYFDKLNSSWS